MEIFTGDNSDKSRAGAENREKESIGEVVKNSQKLDRFFTGFQFGHKKKSFRKLNKVKFQGFLGFCDFTFLYRPGRRAVKKSYSDLAGYGRMHIVAAESFV